MALLIDINFNSEDRLYYINCVSPADKYPVTERNCTQAKLVLTTKR